MPLNWLLRSQHILLMHELQKLPDFADTSHIIVFNNNQVFLPCYPEGEGQRRLILFIIPRHIPSFMLTSARSM